MVSYTLNHLLYMDDIKLSAFYKQNIYQLLKIMKLFNLNVNTNFGMDKWTNSIHKVRKYQSN